MGNLVLNSSVLDKYFGILKDMDIDSKVSTLPTPSFPIAEPDLPLRQKSGYDENIVKGW